MNRRWWGAYLLAAGLLAAAVIPLLSGRRLPGAAQAMNIPAPPTVGACVRTMDDPWATVGLAPGDPDVTMTFPAVVAGRCDDAVAGEVVTVDPGASPPMRITTGDYETATEPCLVAVVPYTGSIAPVVQITPGKPGLVWQPGFDFRATLVGPTSLQRAGGQHWSACVVGQSDGHSYRGRLADVLTTGTLPAAFGSCWTSADLADPGQVDCSRPHPFELLGSTSMGSVQLAAADLQRACRVFASRVMRTADPTRGGTIRIQVMSPDAPGSSTLTSKSAPPWTYILCVAAAPVGRQFDGTVVGIGERPLPLV